mmetsp:Transcript_43239/g.113589  ORF Transcript_43239/g.113589 Transcript_43239/m.113589 type:complete len:145 (+) Transcript_43239:293-727(+)
MRYIAQQLPLPSQPEALRSQQPWQCGGCGEEVNASKVTIVAKKEHLAACTALGRQCLASFVRSPSGSHPLVRVAQALPALIMSDSAEPPLAIKASFARTHAANTFSPRERYSMCEHWPSALASSAHVQLLCHCKLCGDRSDRDV